MKFTNPFFSYRVYKRNKYKKATGFLLVILLGVSVFLIVSAVLQHTRKKSIATEKIMPLSSGDRAQQVEYKNFLKKDAAISESQNLGDSDEVHSLTDLAKIFQKQEKQNQAFFTSPLWQKHAAVGVPLNGKRQVAVIINHAQSLTAQEKSYLKKLGVKWGYLFTETRQGTREKALLLCKEGNEIFIASTLCPNDYKQAVGVVYEPNARPSVLKKLLSVPKKNGSDYKFFTFPLIRELPKFQQSKRTLIILTPRKQRIRNFYDWVKKQKKETQFIPPSQLVSGVAKPNAVISPKKIDQYYHRAN